MKKRRHQKKYNVTQTSTSEQEDAEEEEVEEKQVSSGSAAARDPFYPIYLPIDQSFKAKYVFHQRRSKTFQERLYVFLEHPGGWLCFVYHFSV